MHGYTVAEQRNSGVVECVEVGYGNTVEIAATRAQDFGNVRRNPATALYAASVRRLDAVMAERIGLDLADFHHAQENGQSPAGIVAVAPFAAGTQANFPRRNKVLRPGLQIFEN